MNLDRYNMIFWDFDGVIKDSVDVKTKAFYKLFLPFGEDIAEKVRNHHIENGGMSRFEKIPLYLDWAGQNSSQSKINLFCEKFSTMVFQEVIDSPWVEGVQKIFQSKQDNQTYILVSATPQKEIEMILSSLEIISFFKNIFGAPKSKSEAIKEVIMRDKISISKCVMIGDANSDLKAGQLNKIDFILRRHSSNIKFADAFHGKIINNFM